MKFLIMLLTGIVFYFLLPVWWSVVPAVFLISLFMYKTGRAAFRDGLLCNTVIWVIMILVRTLPNDNLLAERMARLIHLSDWSLLLFVSLIPGALVGGFGALAGYLTGRTLAPYFTFLR
ncbi:MAG: hypothetical protein J0H74_36685 [Chitinophagaceae bacterium]|nr:hypothetical protein [Chitinophagaceae bacterium]